MTEQNDEAITCPTCDQEVEELIDREGYDLECADCIEGAQVLRDQEWDYWHA
jgi:hypothetical protein